MVQRDMDDSKEKQQAWIDAMKIKGHTPKMDDVGLDHFAESSDFHNGPGCSSCGASWCWHCFNPDVIEDCPNKDG